MKDFLAKIGENYPEIRPRKEGRKGYETLANQTKLLPLIYGVVFLFFLIFHFHQVKKRSIVCGIMSGAGYNEALTIEELYAKQSHNESAAGRGSTLFVELNDYENEIINTDTDTDRVGRTSSISARSRSGSASRSNSPSFKGIDPKKNVNRRKSMASFGDAMTPKDQIALIVVPISIYSLPSDNFLLVPYGSQNQPWLLAS